MSSFPHHLTVPDKTSPKKERRSGLSRLISPRRHRRRSNSTSTPSPIPKEKTEKEQLRLNVARSPKFRVDRTLVDYDLLEPTSSEPLALSPRPRLPPRRIGISDPSLAPHAPSSRGRNRRRTIGSKNESVQPLQHELSVQLHSFRPGFPAADRELELLPEEAERVRIELEQVEQFLSLLPSMLESEEGRRQFPYVEQQMSLFFTSFQQTEANIQEVLELLLTESKSDATIVEDLVLLTQRMSDLRSQYESLRTECGMDSINSEENAARLLATQLSTKQLGELLKQASVEFKGSAPKCELEELVVTHQLLQKVDPGNETDEDEFSEDFGERESCIICLDDYHPKHFYALSCGHSYCKYCQKGYIESKINDGDVLDMVCPHPDCQEPFTANDIANLVPVSMANRYDQLKVLGELNKNPNCRWCPSPGCNTAMIGDPCQDTLTCTQCGQGICFHCKQVEHEGKTCEEYAEYRRSHDDDEGRWIEWARNNNAKQCPKCGVWIIRPTGCNQVICKSCQWSFCWLCMKECIVPDHYKYGECEGKWFEDTNLTTSQKIMAGIIFGGVIVLASPILALAGTIALGRRLKRKVRRKKQNSLSDTDSSDFDWN